MYNIKNIEPLLSIDSKAVTPLSISRKE